MSYYKNTDLEQSMRSKPNGVLSGSAVEVNRVNLGKLTAAYDVGNEYDCSGTQGGQSALQYYQASANVTCVRRGGKEYPEKAYLSCVQNGSVNSLLTCMRANDSHKVAFSVLEGEQDPSRDGRTTTAAFTNGLLHMTEEVTDDDLAAFRRLKPKAEKGELNGAEWNEWTAGSVLGYCIINTSLSYDPPEIAEGSGEEEREMVE